MFLPRDEHTYKMPIHFGGQGADPNLTGKCTYHDVTAIRINYETDAAQLENYLPSGFALLQPTLCLSYASCKAIDWMGGGDYNLIDVSVPVKYTGNTQGLTGQYSLVVWENKTEPILTGREDTGIPKLFADIQELRMVNGVYSSNASYYGRTFLDISLCNPVACTKEEVAQTNQSGKFNVFGWRYIANMGRTPGAALSHATLFPQALMLQAQWNGEGAIDWTALPYAQHPAQSHILTQLAALPNMGYTSAYLGKGAYYLFPGDARRLP